VYKRQAYSCATTPFVLLSLLASSNATPIAFSEFRRSSISQDAYAKLLRYVLLAYDVGRDARGRPDQTTTVYPLDAPFTLDGEDALTVPAAMERSISVNLMPETIRAGTEANSSFQELIQLPLYRLAGRYLQHTLTYDVAAALDEAETQIASAFSRRLPDRVRNNLTICAFGYRSLYDFLGRFGVGIAAPTPELFATVFEAPAGEASEPSRGRTPVLADAFVEDLVNAVAGWSGQSGLFAYRWDSRAEELWFQLATAQQWWLVARRRQGQPTLDKRALRQQLKERLMWDPDDPLPGQYMLEPRTQRCAGGSVHMYGIKLSAAVASGLDVPSKLELGQLTISFKPKEKE